MDFIKPTFPLVDVITVRLGVLDTLFPSSKTPYFTGLMSKLYNDDVQPHLSPQSGNRNDTH